MATERSWAPKKGQSGVQVYQGRKGKTNLGKKGLLLLLFIKSTKYVQDILPLFVTCKKGRVVRLGGSRIWNCWEIEAVERGSRKGGGLWCIFSV